MPKVTQEIGGRIRTVSIGFDQTSAPNVVPNAPHILEAVIEADGIHVTVYFSEHVAGSQGLKLVRSGDHTLTYVSGLGDNVYTFVTAGGMSHTMYDGDVVTMGHGVLDFKDFEGNDLLFVSPTVINNSEVPPPT